MLNAPFPVFDWEGTPTGWIYKLDYGHSGAQYTLQVFPPFAVAPLIGHVLDLNNGIQTFDCTGLYGVPPSPTRLVVNLAAFTDRSYFWMRRAGLVEHGVGDRGDRPWIASGALLPTTTRYNTGPMPAEYDVGGPRPTWTVWVPGHTYVEPDEPWATEYLTTD